LTRIRTLLAICAVALPVPAAIAGCGDDDDNSSDADPQQVLDATFNNENRISSANVDLDLSVSAEGDEGGSFEASLGGPFQGDPDDPTTIPQLDWTLTASGDIGGQSVDFEGGAVVTPDNAYVEYGGTAYEVGSENFQAAKQQLEASAPPEKDADVGFSEAFQRGCEQSVRQQGGDPSSCDFDVSAWLTNQTTEGTEDVEGTETNHITGDLNVEQVLTDFGGIASGFPQAQAAPFDFNNLGQLSEAVEDASFDVYSSVDDNTLRKLEFNLAIDPSAISAGTEVPVDSVNLGFALTLGEVNEEQTIEAPSDAQPIEELANQLNLGGLVVPGLGTPDVGDLGGGGGGGGGGAGSDAAQAYLDCISQAQTAEDQAACASELQ
jgi:hypothetical protein